VKVISSRDFNQDVSQAKRAARIEPVFVTDRGKTTHVLMSIEAYRKLSGQTETIVDLLAMAAPVAPDVALDVTGAGSTEVWDSPGSWRG
jgi:PHD/YefM family antitoxin component YafN of YafNO toxin-antitoxin module